MKVLAPPDPLPAPVFEAVLNQCSDKALLSGLVPGAEVTIQRGTDVLANMVKTQRQRSWFVFVPGTSLASGNLLSAVQTLPGRKPSDAGWSERVSQMDPQHFDPPQVGPLTACPDEIPFAGVVATAEVVAEAEDGSVYSWYAPREEFSGTLPGVLPEGILRVRQQLPFCELRSQDAEVPVGPEQEPPPPRPRWFCPETKQIDVEGLTKGAQVEFSSGAWNGHDYTPETPLMLGGATGESPQRFGLPAVVGGAPGPITSILVRQTKCTKTSAPGVARELPRPGEGFAPPPAPQILGPVYTCVQTVLLRPDGYGGTGVLCSLRTGQQLADSFTLGNSSLSTVLNLWSPAVAHDEIQVQYTGCGAAAPVSTQVIDLPDPMPDVTIVPPLPGDTDLVITGALPGARVVSIVDGATRSARPTIDGSVTLPLGPPLTEGQHVWAYQRLCNTSGNDQKYLTVTRARMTASCAPNSITAGAAVALRVTAVRADTGAEADGLPVALGGKTVGTTGSAFPYTASGPGTITGTVLGAPRYMDASFTVTVVPAPPPTGSTLTLQLGGAVGGYGNPISISKLTWRVTPSWPPAAPITANGLTATVTLPAATGPNPTAAIYVDAFEATYTNLGTPYKLWLDAPTPAAVVALTAKNLHVGFLLTPELRAVVDPNGNPVDYVWVAVVRFQGVA